MPSCMLCMLAPALQVLKWSDGSYLEDQDMWWLSGIHRHAGQGHARRAGPCPQTAIRCRLTSCSTHRTCWPPLYCVLTSRNPITTMAPACRDVYLLVKPREHIADFYARTPLQFDATTGKPCAAR